MKSKSMILMFVSLGFGLIAAIGISQVMGKNKGTTDPSVQMSPVLVAVDHLDLHTQLTAENVKIDHWPMKIMPEDATTDLAEIEDMAITTRVAKGMPILRKDLIPKGEIRELPIPEGFKVVAIKVSADDTINGLLKPGHRVDVIGVFKTREEGATVSVSKTFLKNIQVFSVNDSFHNERSAMESNGSKNNSILGVLLNEKQSERLVLVQKVAQLKIALRGNSSSNEVDDAELANLDEELEKYINGSNYGSKPEEEDTDDEPKEYFTSRVPRGFTQRVWNGSEMVEFIHGQDGAVTQKGGEAVPFTGTNGADSTEDSSDDDIDSDLEEDQYVGE